MATLQGDVAGESYSAPLRVGFDRRLKLQFHGTKMSSDGGLLLFRELGAAVGFALRFELHEQRLQIALSKGL